MIRIHTLVDNLVYVPGLKAEHGLSFFVETDNGKFLFDTGQTDVFLHNAQRKHIDLSTIDFVAISHGHYDHSGGLETLLSLNVSMPIYLKKEALKLKYSSDGRKIGMKRELRESSLCFKFIDSLSQPIPGVFIVPEIPITYPLDTNFEQMKVDDNGNKIPDEFHDELFVCIQSTAGIVILSSCSHRGISNICETAIKIFNQPIIAVVGGFHTRNANEEQFNHLTRFFNKMQPQQLGICHCTGINGFTKLYNALGRTVFYNAVGNCIELT